MLHTFLDSGTEGAVPLAALIQATDGNFYEQQHGAAGWDFALVDNAERSSRSAPAGAFTKLHSFGGDDGGNPNAALIQGIDGNFYGTTAEGGIHGSGTVFKISSEGAFTC